MMKTHQKLTVRIQRRVTLSWLRFLTQTRKHSVNSASELLRYEISDVHHHHLTMVFQAPDSGLKLGPLYQFGYCAAHLYCLMFSAGLDQNGSDDQGINGFLAQDIVREWRRGSMLKCCYCKEKYATIGCIGNKCKYASSFLTSTSL